MPRWLIAVMTFALVFSTCTSGIFMFAALIMSLWAGVFWYGVSTTTLSTVVLMWFDYVKRRV